MDAYILRHGSGLDGLTRTDAPHRPLGAHDVRVSIRAAALNYRDLLYSRGLYPDPPARAIVPLCDGIGEVVETGASVTRFRTGDRVITTYWPRWADGSISPAKTAISFGTQVDGTLAETLAASEEALTLAPANVGDAAGAGIPCAGVTAWNALFVQGAARPGATVLILGTGGVAIWALQLAAAAGLRAIVTSSSDDKLQRAEALGAHGLVNYRTHPEWQHEVLRITGGQGVDVVLEVGGENTLPRSIAATGFGGRVVVIGGLSGFGGASIDPHSLIFGAKTLAAVSVGSRAMAEDLVRFIELKRIEPVVDQAFGFGEARAAYEHLEAGRAFGKVVVNVL